MNSVQAVYFLQHNLSKLGFATVYDNVLNLVTCCVLLYFQVRDVFIPPAINHSLIHKWNTKHKIETLHGGNFFL
jgi:hypothetical protein